MRGKLGVYWGEKKFNEESCEEMCLQEFLLKGNKEMIFFSQ